MWLIQIQQIRWFFDKETFHRGIMPDSFAHIEKLHKNMCMQKLVYSIRNPKTGKTCSINTYRQYRIGKCVTVVVYGDREFYLLK